MKGGVKTDNIIDFYNEFIKSKYSNIVIMDNIHIFARTENVNNLTFQTIEMLKMLNMLNMLKMLYIFCNIYILCIINPL